MIQKLKSLLDANNVKYITISHSPAFTAQEIAASAHVSGKEVAKIVIIKVDGKFAMAVLPASHLVDFNKLRDGIGAGHVDLAKEDEFRSIFEDSEVGAMPPFGNLYDLDVYVADRLTEDREILFNAGNFRELLRLSFDDFNRLVKPKIIKYAEAQRSTKKVERPVHSDE